jgi:integrase
LSPELSKALTSARNLLLRDPESKVFEQFDPNPVLRRLCGHAGLENIRFHDLRHTFASLALDSGISPKQVQEWLGHASVVTTLSIYWNLTKEEANLDFLPGVAQ